MADLTRDPQIATATDVVSSVAWSPTDADVLLSGSWDGAATLYNANTASVLQSFKHLAPVLDVCFSGAADSGSTAFSGSLDRQLRQLDLSTGQQTILGAHKDAIRCVNWSEETNLLFTAGWDSALKAWDLRQPGGQAARTAQLPSKAYSMDARGNSLVVAGADRHVSLYDLNSLAGGQLEPAQKRISSLKFMTRSLRINPAATAYANTSIEGRVAVEFLDASQEQQDKKYAFKVCHRASINGVDTVFPVNALAFHPIHGTFATGGGDGMTAVWDLAAKKRLRQLPKYPSSISDLSFNCDGTRMAVAGSAFLEEGTSKEGMQNAIWVRSGVLDECKPKSKA